MFIENGAVVFEQVGFPGNVGDQCAETARWDRLCSLLNLPSPMKLDQFFTDKGILRSPKLAGYKDDKGDSWAEDDTTSDQVGPLFMAVKHRLELTYLKKKIRDNVHQNSWWGRTGNGDLVNPKLHAAINERQTLLEWSMRGQAFALNLPFRWSDSENKFEAMGESSADYLNYFHYGFEVPQAVRRKISAEKMLDRIVSYYAKEPNSKQLVDLYHTALTLRW